MVLSQNMSHVAVHVTNPCQNIWTAVLYVRRVDFLTPYSTMVTSLLKNHGEFGPLQPKDVEDQSETIPVTATTLITVLKNKEILQEWSWFCLGKKRKKKGKSSNSRSSGSAGRINGQKNYSLKKEGERFRLENRKTFQGC